METLAERKTRVISLIETMAEENNFTHLVPLFISQLKAAVQLKASRRGPPSLSFLGGEPIAPPDFQWPTWNLAKYINTPGSFTIIIDKEELVERVPNDTLEAFPLDFIGQIDLSEVASFEGVPPLPKEGILYFFWDTATWVSHSSPFPKGAGKILYVPQRDIASSVTIPAPPSRGSLSDVCGRPSTTFDRAYLSYEPCWTLPDNLDLVWEQKIANEYEDLRIKFQPFPQFRDHQLGGHMVMPSDYRLMPSLKGVRKKDWELILSIGPDDPDFMGSTGAGALFFWVPKADLANLDFERTWVECLS